MKKVRFLFVAIALLGLAGGFVAFRMKDDSPLCMYTMDVQRGVCVGLARVLTPGNITVQNATYFTTSTNVQCFGLVAPLANCQQTISVVFE